MHSSDEEQDNSSQKKASGSGRESQETSEVEASEAEDPQIESSCVIDIDAAAVAAPVSNQEHTALQDAPEVIPDNPQDVALQAAPQAPEDTSSNSEEEGPPLSDAVPNLPLPTAPPVDEPIANLQILANHLVHNADAIWGYYALHVPQQQELQQANDAPQEHPSALEWHELIGADIPPVTNGQVVIPVTPDIQQQAQQSWLQGVCCGSCSIM